MSGALRIEPAKVSSDAEVAALATACFDRATEAAEVATLRAGRHTEVWVARLADAVVGYAVLQIVVDEAELHTIGVDPSRRRQGIGGALLARVLARARDGGASRVFLEVARHNLAAVSLYEAHGFATDAVRAGYYADGADALVMSRPA